MRQFKDACRRILCAALCAAILVLGVPQPAYAVERSLFLPRGMQVIDDWAFYADRSFNRVVLPDGVTSIGSKAFAFARLDEITLPSSITYIAHDAFSMVSDSMVIYAEDGSYAANWCIEHGKDYQPIGSDADECKLIVSSASCSFPKQGGTSQIRFSDSKAVSVTTSNASWLTVAVGNGLLTLTAPAYDGALARQGTVSLTCGHGTSAVIVVTQQGSSVQPQLSVTCGGETVHEGDVLVELTDPAGYELSLSIDAQDAAVMQIMLVAPNGEPIDVSENAYYGAPLTDWSLMLPDGMEDGVYTLTISVSSRESIGDEPACDAIITAQVLVVSECNLVLNQSAVHFSEYDSSTNVYVLSDQIASIDYLDKSQSNPGKRWLDVNVSGDRLAIHARRNFSDQPRNQLIAITCVHGKTMVLPVTQDACTDSPSLALYYDGRWLTNNASFGTFANTSEHDINIAISCSNVNMMDFSMTDANGNGVMDFSHYFGEPLPVVSFKLPVGFDPGVYTLSFIGYNSDMDYDEWTQECCFTTTFEVTEAPSNPPVPFYSMSSAYMNSVYYQRLMQINMTGDKAYDIVQIAKSQVGYHEGALDGSGASSSNYTEYGRSLGYSTTAWCAAFVSWCARMAKANCISSSIYATPVFMITSASAGHCYSFRTYNEVARSVNNNPAFMLDSSRCTYVDRTTFVPRKGDLIYISNGSNHLAHVGIVNSIDGSNVYYYDGNGEEMDQVKASVRTLTDTAITMYARPNY